MKSKYSASSPFTQCIFIALASVPFAGVVNAQSPGVFSKLNVGDSTGTATGDGTFVAEGTPGISPPLAAAYQTSGTRMLWYPGIAAFRVGYGNASTWNEATMGWFSTAMGYSNTAQGWFSSAMGYNNWAQGHSSTAMGQNNSAQGSYSTAMGISNLSTSCAETVIGSYNAPLGGTQNYWVESDPIFQIGNGHETLYETETGIDYNGDGVIDQNHQVSLPAINSNALTVFKNGNMELQGNLTLGGTITSGGSQVLTASSSPPLNSAWTSTYLLKGDVGQTGGGLLAVGNSSAHGTGSVAIGNGASALGNQTLAFGEYSRAESTSYSSVAIVGGKVSKSYSLAAFYGEATGDLSIALSAGFASGDSSIALGGYDWQYGNWPGNESIGESSSAIGGVGNQSIGFASLATGFWSKAKSLGSTSLGSLNIGVGSSTNNWVETDSLFELGNGNAPRDSVDPGAAFRSNAITTLKNGQTTLTNKAWKTDHSVAPSATNSDAQALIVEGHAVMKGNTTMEGKVIIAAPQGDISMGAYQ